MKGSRYCHVLPVSWNKTGEKAKKVFTRERMINIGLTFGSLIFFGYVFYWIYRAWHFPGP